MLPTPDIPASEYEVRHANHVAHVRAALAAVIIFLICALLVSVHV